MNRMILLRNLGFSFLLTCALATTPRPPHSPETSPSIGQPSPNLLLPRVQPAWITTQSTGAHVTWGNYAITFWRSTAILPVVAAVQPMRDFYNKVTLAAIQAMGNRLVTSSYKFGLGALNLHVDTLDGSPIDWEMLISFAGNMVGMTNLGWTDHYAAVVKDKVTGVLTLVSLDAGGAAVAWLNGGTWVEQFKNDPFAT